MKILEFVFTAFVMVAVTPIIWNICRIVSLFIKTLLSKDIVVMLANNTQKQIIKSK